MAFVTCSCAPAAQRNLEGEGGFPAASHLCFTEEDAESQGGEGLIWRGYRVN